LKDSHGHLYRYVPELAGRALNVGTILTLLHVLQKLFLIFVLVLREDFDDDASVASIGNEVRRGVVPSRYGGYIEASTQQAAISAQLGQGGSGFLGILGAGQARTKGL